MIGRNGYSNCGIIVIEEIGFKRIDGGKNIEDGGSMRRQSLGGNKKVTLDPLSEKERKNWFAE